MPAKGKRVGRDSLSYCTRSNQLGPQKARRRWNVDEKKSDDLVKGLEDLEITELDDRDLEDVSGGSREIDGDGGGNTNCGCNGGTFTGGSGNENCGC